MSRINFILFSILVFFGISCTDDALQRQTIRLDGEWTIAKTDGELPAAFTSKIPVPGLVDLAVPPIDTVGAHYPEGWYWHQRKFDLVNTDFEKIELKVYKAKYHTKVYINGKFAGENLYCFTPSYFDVKPFLLPAGQTNEIIIGIGCYSQLPDTINDGYDIEKLRYIPGIYDHVEITLSNRPFISNIQCVPDIVNEKLRVVAEIETESPQGLRLSYQVSEAASGKTVASKRIKPKATQEKGFVKVDFEINMKGAKLWSPESPFLYELALNTGADNKRVKFGMRSFRFDPEKRLALLNEKPYYMRGTNVCFFRFEEDADRGSLPWDKQWPVTLHERFKDMNWGTMRYCIGFPPERWYDICDSIGFMLQDEFPYWLEKKTVTAPHIAEEYRLWMRERWNHPSVVIWDAQNETETEETGKAILAVRGLDLSGRPWENGWAAPVELSYPIETHPYLYGSYGRRNYINSEAGFKKEMFSVIRRPGNDAQDRINRRNRGTGITVTYDNPSIINEYGYIWLNRNGTPTTLTERIYENLWDSKNLTPQRRLEIYARCLAELTEYWRAHRRAVGVLHFCGLAYSRPDEPRGQTSDNFSDIKNLTFEPSFFKYVKHSFAPVGLMIDTCEKEYAGGDKINVPVFVINDLEQPFNQEIQLSILIGEQVVSTYKKEVQVKPYEVLTVPFEVVIPDKAGDYLMRGEYTLKGDNVFCLRDIPVK